MRERSLEVMPDRHRPTWQRTSLFLMATTILLFACANQALAHAVAEAAPVAMLDRHADWGHETRHPIPHRVLHTSAMLRPFGD